MMKLDKFAEVLLKIDRYEPFDNQSCVTGYGICSDEYVIVVVKDIGFYTMSCTRHIQEHINRGWELYE